MASKVSTGERLRYEFDKSMAAGPIALIGWLTVVSLIIIVLAAIVLTVTGIAPEGGEPLGLIEGFWASLMRTMDAGALGGDSGWPFRVIMLVVTIAGIFVFSALIGVLGSGIDAKLEELRKGRSRVLETGHTIILNWSPSIFDIISELVIANQSVRRPRIVIMADKDKVEMEDEIKAKVATLGDTRIICRSGDPTDLYDLALVNPQSSKSIIVLSPETDDPDSNVIKTVLALTNDPNRRTDRYMISAEVRDSANAEVARIVGGDEVQLVLADNLIARIVVHSSRQAGLSAVYQELLDFDGCEIYTTAQPALTGKTFGEALMAYESSALMGLCEADGSVSLNPPMDTVIAEGQRAIIVAEDDDKITVTSLAAEAIDESAIRPAPEQHTAPERTLILGWNRRGPIIAAELARYMAPGSLLTIGADTPTLADEVAALDNPEDNLEIEVKVLDTSSAAEMRALDVPSYDHVIVLSYSDTMEAQAADTRTLVALLHLRKIAEVADKKMSIVSEMADIRNRELAEVTRADDFVVSNKLVSLMLAQASENDRIAAIFDDLLDEQGSEFYMRPIEDYVSIDGPLTFYTIAESARRRGEVALGYRRNRAQPGSGRSLGGVVLNPPKSEKLDYVTADRVVVLARD